MHDLWHGVFHVDKGIFYTVKELFTRPGDSVREYVMGKRVNHFHYFTLIVILLILDKILFKMSGFEFTNLETGTNMEEIRSFEHFIKEYSKLITLTLLPLQAAISFLVFRKLNQNFAVHIVLTSYLISGMLLLDLTISIAAIFIKQNSIMAILAFSIELIKLFYGAIFIFTYFKEYGEYSNLKLIIMSFFTVSIILFLTYWSYFYF
jgi:hypothetical protein